MMEAVLDGRAALTRAAEALRGGEAGVALGLVEAALASGVEPPREPVPCRLCDGTGEDEGVTCFACRGAGATDPAWPRIVRGMGRGGDPDDGGPIRRGFRRPGWVSVRPCDPALEGKTFLGYYVGDVPTSVAAGIGKDGTLSLHLSAHNPAIMVFDLGRVVYGYESWWGVLRGPEDLKAISDTLIDSTWYVVALRQLSEKARREALHPADLYAELLRDPAPDKEDVERVVARLVSDREARVGATCQVIVETVPTGHSLSVRPLPDLRAVRSLLADGDFSVVDCETTGLHHAVDDRVVSVEVLEGCLSRDATAFLPNGVTFSETVDPGRASGPGALAVHGLDEAGLAGRPSFGEVAPRLATAIEGRVLVAHNAPFDTGFLDMELSLAGLPPTGDLATDVVDTRVVCKMVWPGEPAGLDALAERLGIDRGDRDVVHTAGGDTRLLAACLPGLVAAIDAMLPVDDTPGIEAWDGPRVPDADPATEEARRERYWDWLDGANLGPDDAPRFAEASDGSYWAHVSTGPQADREAAGMRHSVGHSFDHYGRLGPIYSLRDDGGVPRATILVSDGRVVHARGVGDKPLAAAELDEVRRLADDRGWPVAPAEAL